MSFAFPPAPTPSLPIAGSDKRFPVRRVWCVGRNYLAHVREMGNDEREPPFFFSKQPDMVVHAGSVTYPPLTDDLNYEGELVIALKSGGASIAEADALSHVFGYCVGLDLTRRERQNAAKAKGKPWEASKSFDQSGPCGPITESAQAGELSKAPIRLAVNGVVKQDSNIANMIWSIPEIIARVSRDVSLSAGDLIFTGTPEGVGPVVRGDRLEVRVGNLAPLAITIT